MRGYRIIRTLFITITCTLAITFGTSAATTKETKYQYDRVGRLICVEYADGVIYTYSYDENGNITNVVKSKEQSSTNDKELDDAGTGKVSDKGSDKNASGGEIGLEGTTEEEYQDKLKVQKALELRRIQQFRKKRPILKKLKKYKKKGKYYIRVEIVQMIPRNLVGESGYQVEYATNKRFKKRKKISVKRIRKGTITKRGWKVKKKTYYVRVRAYQKMQNGKTVYSRYSKTRKIRIRK